MLIALISDEYPPARVAGGIGSYTKAIAALLAGSAEHEVHVFCQDDALEKRSSGESIHTVRAWNPSSRLARRLYHLALGIIGPFAYRFAWGIAAARAIQTVEAALGRRFDVIEVPEAGGYGAIVRFGGVTNPLVVRLHTCTELLRKYGALRPTTSERLVEMMERTSVARADLITSPSSALVGESRAPLRIGNRPCRVYPNARQHRQGGAVSPITTRRDATVLVVGRLCYLKGTDLIVEAAGLLQRSHHPGLRLTFAGRIDWTPEQLSKLLTAHLAQGTYASLGEVPQSRVHEEMRAATLLVQPSRFENYPTTILEAFEESCPVVAADAGGMPELVSHRETGLLFTSGSATSLAEQIAWILDNREESMRCAARAKAWIESNLSDQKILASTIQAYATAIAGRRSAQGKVPPAVIRT